MASTPRTSRASFQWNDPLLLDSQQARPGADNATGGP